MARRKQADEAKKGAPEWMATYSDMVTLLLCFFVLLFAMSSIDVQKFQAVVQSLNGSLGVLDSGTTVNMEPLINNFPNDSPTENNEEFKDLKAEIEAFLEENNLEGSILVEINERGLLIRFLDKVLFDSGKADLKPDAQQIILKVSELLKQTVNNIKIEGHTDNRPISTSRFPSNWELSSQRASNVLHYLEESCGIENTRLSTSGYADTRPVDTNETVEGRQNNRRVDIIILRSSMDALEPN